MGADHFLGFYGIKIAIDPDDEDTFEACGLGTDPRCVRAKKAGLETHSGRMTEGEDYFLYVGRQLAAIGLEGGSHDAHPLQKLVDVAADIDPRLRQAGFDEKPALHFQFIGQY